MSNIERPRILSVYAAPSEIQFRITQFRLGTEAACVLHAYSEGQSGGDGPKPRNQGLRVRYAYSLTREDRA